MLLALPQLPCFLESAKPLLKKQHAHQNDPEIVVDRREKLRSERRCLSVLNDLAVGGLRRRVLSGASQRISLVL